MLLADEEAGRVPLALQNLLDALFDGCQLILLKHLLYLLAVLFEAGEEVLCSSSAVCREGPDSLHHLAGELLAPFV